MLLTTSHRSMDERPVLKPPANMTPLSIRAFRFTSTPFQCCQLSPMLADVPADVFRTVRDTCAREWGPDFRMRVHCETQQWDGYRAVR